MNSQTHALLAKVLVLGLVVFVLTAASFGLGVSVGSHLPGGLGPQEARAVGAPAASDSDQTDNPTGGPSELVDMKLFSEVWSLLQKQFYGDLPQGKEVTYNAIRGLVDRLGDRHTGFLDPQNAALANDLEGHFEGIGAGVEAADGGGVRISYVYPDQPADRAGLVADDVITAVDGKDITRLTLTEAIGLIRGPAGTQVRLTVIREDKAPFVITATRARIEIPVVSSKTLGDGQIAYIALSEFSSVAPGRLAEAIRQAQAGNPTGIILDMRGNPGGFLDAAVRIGSYFVPEGDILVERFKDGTEHVYHREGSYLLDRTPLVVLVDGGSASAAEIVAGAIQDAGTGILMGEKTYGKGSVQLVNALTDGSQLRVTVAHWFTPKNRGIHETGLEPDVAVPLSKEDLAERRDVELDRAVRWLLGDHTMPPAATPEDALATSPAVTPEVTPEGTAAPTPVGP